MLGQGPSLALADVATQDQAAEATIQLTPQEDGDAGLVLRARGPGDRLTARFLWQGGSPEIEIWESVGGQVRFVNAVNISGRFSLGEDHRLTFAAVGREVAAYLDGRLVVQGTISEAAARTLTDGWAGLSIDSNASAQFKGFRAGAARLSNGSANPPTKPSCAPRPPVTVTTQQGAPGTLQATVTVTRSAAAPNNTVAQIQFGPAQNAIVEINGQAAPGGNYTATLPAGARQTTFVVRRSPANATATTVPFTVIDDCGAGSRSWVAARTRSDLKGGGGYAETMVGQAVAGIEGARFTVSDCPTHASRAYPGWSAA